MINMKYLGQKVDCKLFFKGRYSEMGRCFTSNRLLDHKTIQDNFNSLPMKFASAGRVDRTISFDYVDLQFASPMVVNYL